jgi:hypothetical protein
MKIQTAFLGSVMSILLVSGPSSATPADDVEMIKANAPKISAIIASVAQSTAAVDRSLHDKLWALLPSSIRNDPSFFQSLDIVKAMTYQKELWESIRLSARAGRVVKTISFDSARERANAGNPRAKEVSALADRMLVSAASGKPYQGETFSGYLTEEKANQVLDGLNATFARLQLLLNPQWQGR